MALAENALAAVGVSVQFGTVRGTTDRSIFVSGNFSDYLHLILK